MTSNDNCRGCLMGLAVGDALGTTLEFSPPGTFEPITDMIGGGPFKLEPGQWTDDTSMALCLAESLIGWVGLGNECSTDLYEDQMKRYLKWYREGYLSSTGKCFDIGNTTRKALEKFEKTGDPFCGSTDSKESGNGSIMRLAPVPMFFRDFSPSDDLDYVGKAGQSSQTTHGSREACDACGYLAVLIVGALEGVDKDTLLSPMYSHERCPVSTGKIHHIMNGSFRFGDQIKSTGYVVDTLEAALWAFHYSSSFEEGCLMAVNLGNDADTTGAVYGQLAGAFYGLEGIPKKWVDKIAMKELILDYADKLNYRNL